MRKRSAHVNVSQTNIHVEPSSLFDFQGQVCCSQGFLDRQRQFSNKNDKDRNTPSITIAPILSFMQSSVIIVFGLFLDLSLSARSLRKEMAPRNRIRPWSNCMPGDVSSTPWQTLFFLFLYYSHAKVTFIFFTLFHKKITFMRGIKPAS